MVHPYTARDAEFPFTLTRDTSGGNGLTFEGYAAVFNTPTRIRDDDGEYDEVIAPGAFKRSISRKTPVFMFDHGKHPMIGNMPLGTITELREDARGLYVQARLTDNWLVAPVRDAIANDAINGMSFRFAPTKQVWSGAPNGRCRYGELRTVKEVDCPELGPVVSPAYSDTTAAVRSCFRALESTLPGLVQVSFRDQEGLVINDDASDPKELVEDALERLWGLNDFQSDVYTVDFFDDHAVFYVLGGEQSEYQGLWQVDYTYTNGSVSIGTPVNVKASGYVPTAPITDAASFDPNLNSAPITGTVRSETAAGPSEEPAVTGPSTEPANHVEPAGPSTQAERRQYLRQLQLARRGITQKETA